ncbi:MAG: N-acetyl sugar amidotransferase [Candidatus Omnitrophota bacterium]
MVELKRCSKCLLPQTYPDIVFDGQGVCHKCKEHDEKYGNKDYKKCEKELCSIFDWARGQEKPYDCVVPFSGGKDSSYTLYVCRKIYGLKVLAVNFINGLQTYEAIINMKRITEKLDVAFTSYGPSPETLRRLYQAFLMKTGQFCFPCDMGIWRTVHNAAEQYDAPLIVSGFSAQIESRGKKIYSYSNKLFQAVAEGVISKREMRDFLEETAWQKLWRRLKRGRLTRYRRQISLPDYMEWDDNVIKNTITNELGWEKRKDGSSDHIDCALAPLKNYLVVQKWGFGEKTTKYAAMVRAGQLGRSEALKKAETEEDPAVAGDVEKYCAMLKISKSDLLAARGKTHLDKL